MNPKVREIPAANWRKKLHEVIFEAETRPGKIFDVVLIGAIILSVLAVVLESVKEIRETYARLSFLRKLFSLSFSRSNIF